MKLVIVTPQGSSTIDDLDKITIPASEGVFMALRGHGALISAIRGVIRCSQKEIDIESGVVEVKNNIITVITDR
jgi:F0F1-type ATP synthase epsilon subunit